MTDIETFVEVSIIGAMAAVAAFLIFGWGSRAAGPSFQVFPASRREWVAYGFHTLEFLLFCCVLVTRHPALWWLPSKVLEVTGYLFLSLPVVLLISAILCWSHERSLARAGLLWAGIGVIGFFLVPEIHAT